MADVKASAAAVTAGGGKVVYAPVMLGERGETAVFKDPEGVLFGVVNSKNGDPPDYAGDVNEWYWVDLWTRDVEKAATFYRAVVGYDTLPIADDGPRSGLHLLSGGFARAGIMQKHEQEVEFDLAAVHSRRRRQGIRPRPPGPPVARCCWSRLAMSRATVAIIADPTGAPVGIVQVPATEAQP